MRGCWISERLSKKCIQKKEFAQIIKFKIYQINKYSALDEITKFNAHEISHYTVCYLNCISL